LDSIVSFDPDIPTSALEIEHDEKNLLISREVPFQWGMYDCSPVFPGVSLIHCLAETSAFTFALTVGSPQQILSSVNIVASGCPNPKEEFFKVVLRVGCLSSVTGRRLSFRVFCLKFLFIYLFIIFRKRGVEGTGFLIDIPSWPINPSRRQGAV
jgi:hypothetical protein